MMIFLEPCKFQFNHGLSFHMSSQASFIKPDRLRGTGELQEPLWIHSREYAGLATGFCLPHDGGGCKRASEAGQRILPEGLWPNSWLWRQSGCAHVVARRMEAGEVGLERLKFSLVSDEWFDS